MKARTRFIQSVVKTAQGDKTRLPWTRGVVRDVAVASRRGPSIIPKIRTA